MFTVYVIVTIVVALVDIYAAYTDVVRPQWLLDNMAELDVNESQLPLLASLKAAGGIGLLVGIAIPVVGLAAAIGLILYFVLALARVLRCAAHRQIPYPTIWLVLNIAALVLLLVAW